MISHDGEMRRYLLHVPPSYDGTERTPVVFLFHGYSGSPERVMRASAMAELADLEGFLVVAPLARGAVSKWDFRSPGSIVNSDVGFVRRLAESVAATGCIDPDREYAAGFSNGSALALAVACDPQSPFEAYGAVSGPYIAPDCRRAKPASIAYFHGVRDDIVPYAGSQTTIGPIGGVDDTIAAWVAHDRCPADRATTSVSGVVRHSAWRGCADGSAISVYVREDAGHSWPERPLDASALMWQFFSRA